MLNELTKQNQKKVLTIDSREVAEMLGKKHKYVLRDIEGTDKVVGIIPTLESANLHYQDYFISSSYQSGTREYKCYLVTKMGCELLGNKQQGEKGILFSAKYVKKFNEMEKYIKQENQFKLPQTYKEALLQLVEQVEKNEQLENKNKLLIGENNALSQDIIKWANENVINALVRKYGANIRNDFGSAWVEFKKNLLYKYSINLNSRITAYLNETGKKTKPKTLSMLRGREELTKGLKTAISMCRDESIDVSDILGKHLNNEELKMISEVM